MKSHRTPPIVLAGTGRSGTSWLLELLTSEPTYRAVFEPLHPVNVPSAQDFYDLYLTDEDANAPLEEFFDEVFYGRPKAWLRWMTFRTPKADSTLKLFARMVLHRDRFRPSSSTRVVKLIKGNLMLHWLSAHYPAKLVFLIRHPCAVVSSQLKMGWPLDLTRYSSQTPLLRDYISNQTETIQMAKSPVERLAVRWCIENLVPLTQIRKGQLPCRIVYFEDLVHRTEETLSAILADLSLSTAETSRFVNRMKTGLPPHAATLTSWQKSLTASEQAIVLRTAREFGITDYGDDPLPSCRG